MAYVLPNFNLTCNLAKPAVNWATKWVGSTVRVPDQPCCLVYGRRVPFGAITTASPSADSYKITMTILFPPLTDVRGGQDSVSWDVIECPAGSGRYYIAVAVDDIGKGYANEHRIAWVIPTTEEWVAPYN